MTATQTATDTAATGTKLTAASAVRKAKKLMLNRIQQKHLKREEKELQADVLNLLGLLDVDSVTFDGDKKAQAVRPTSKKYDAEAIEKYVKRYKPELYDMLFPPVRKLDIATFDVMLASGALPAATAKHVERTSGTPYVKVPTN
jgi:hypothetical protein